MTLVTLLMTNNYITLATLFWCAIIIIFVTHTNIVELIIADTTYPAVIIHFTKFAINCFVPHWVFRYLNIKLTYSCWTSALTVFICKTSVPSTFLASSTCSLLLVFPATSFVYFCSWCCDRNISNTSSNCGVLQEKELDFELYSIAMRLVLHSVASALHYQDQRLLRHDEFAAPSQIYML